MGLVADIAPIDTQERVYIQQIRGRAKNWAGTSKKNTVSFFKEHCGASVPCSPSRNDPDGKPLDPAEYLVGDATHQKFRRRR